MNRFILSLFIFIFPIVLFAEQGDFGVTLSASRDQAIPFVPITVTADSYSIDLDRAVFSWSINGKVIKSGTGVKSITYRPGALGTTANVLLTVSSVEGGQVTIQKIIPTTDADIIWEAYDTYTPAFYKGKAIPTDEASVRAVAMPDMPGFGSTFKSKDFVYTWKRNYDVVGNFSGSGKSSFSFSLDYLNTEEKLGVDIGSNTRTFSASANSNIFVKKPDIVFYQRTADGITHFEKSLNGNDSLYGGSLIMASPFGMSPRNYNSPDLSFEWTNNGGSLSSNSIKNAVAVNDVASGILEVLVTNTKSLFQEVSKTLSIGS